MFLDNFSGHKPNYTYSNIEICFLPKNSSAKLQPLDAEIIRSFKSKYFNYQMSNIVLKTTSVINAETLYKQFSLKDALVYISYAWKDVTSETLKNCWNKTGLYKDETSEGVGFGIDDYSNLCSHLNIIDLADEDGNLSLELDVTQKICQINISELVKKT